MKNWLKMVIMMAAASANANEIISAEELANVHTRDAARAVGEQLGLEFYDGPYDGEIAIFDCSVNNKETCYNYEGFVDGNLLPDIHELTDQEVENYIYYAAVRNLWAVLWTSEPEMVAWIRAKGEYNVIAAEIMLMKTNQKPMSLWQNMRSKQDLVNRARMVYGNGGYIQ